MKRPLKPPSQPEMSGLAQALEGFCNIGALASGQGHNALWPVYLVQVEPVDNHGLVYGCVRVDAEDHDKRLLPG